MVPDRYRLDDRASPEDIQEILASAAHWCVVPLISLLRMSRFVLTGCYTLGRSHETVLDIRRRPLPCLLEPL